MRVVRGLGALVLIAALLVGIPWGLWLVAGSPIPTTVPDLSDVVDRLLRPDVTGALVLTVVKYAGWIAWATFAAAVLVEIPARLRGVPAPRIRGLRLQQRAAGVLVAAIIAMLTVAPVLTAAPAHAAAPAAPGVSVSAGIDAVQAAPAVATPAEAGGDRTAAQEAETQDQDAQATFAYVVQQGDSLWKIAEKYLGSGDRYPEIAALNYGVTQPGGYALDASHWIDPGWTLTIPGHDPAGTPAGTPETAPDSGMLTYVAERGDTLWELAEEHLGDGFRFAEILDASRDVVQPGGAHLTDPRGLQPGWTVLIPVGPPPTAEPMSADVVAVAPPTVVETPQLTPAVPATAPVTTPVTTPATTPTTTAPDGAGAVPAGTDQDAEQDDVVRVATVAGIGATAAVGLLGLLAARRRRAERDRAPGERVTLPAPDSAPALLEAELRDVADPVSVDDLDTALRALGAWHARRALALPAVRAVRLLPTRIELYLEEPAPLPDPWQGEPDALVWVIERDAIDALDHGQTAPAPYPGLVALGQDAEGAHLLIDLEEVGVLNVTGPADSVAALAAGVVIELAAGPWADDLQVTCVGLLDDLEPALDSGRVRHEEYLEHALAQAERRAAAAAAQLDLAGCTHVRQARGAGAAHGVLNPEVLVIARTPSSADLARLARLAAGGHAVAVVVAGPSAPGRWELEVGPLSDRRARLQPMGVELTPQLLDEETYARLLALLDPDTVVLVPGPQWAHGLVRRDEPALDELTRVRAVATADETDGTAAGDLATPGAARGAGIHGTDLAAGTGPLVRVLGPVEVENCRGVAPATAHRERSLELGAYLATHPTGVATAEIAAALWPGRQAGMRVRVPTAVSRVRRWWGTSSAGREHVSAVRDERRGIELYRTAEVTTDWQRFVELVGPDAARTPTARLVAALDLVRGRPLEARRVYAWSAGLEAEMRSAVLDIAHEVASRAFDDGRPERARAAAAAARSVDPADERGWRDGLRAAWACGDHAEVRLLASAYYGGAAGRDHEPDQDTDALIDELIGRVAA